MVKDNTALPFEVTYAEAPGEKPRTMKRLAVLVKAENVSDIISSLKELNLGATIYDVKGVTKDKERVACQVEEVVQLNLHTILEKLSLL